jgi:hypothetical protein
VERAWWFPGEVNVDCGSPVVVFVNARPMSIRKEVNRKRGETHSKYKKAAVPFETVRRLLFSLKFL